MLGSQQIFLALNDEIEEYDDLVEIMSNAHLNNNFLALAREVGKIIVGQKLKIFVAVSLQCRNLKIFSKFFHTCKVVRSRKPFSPVGRALLIHSYCSNSKRFINM